MTPNPQSVRRANPEDAIRLIASAVSILLEGCLQPVSEGKVTTLVARCVNQDGAIAGIIDGPSGIEASIGLEIDSFDYSVEQHLRVIWLGVHPAFRRENHGSRLIEFAKWAADTMDLPLFVDLLTSKDLEAKLHAYLRLVPQVGAVFSWGGVPEGAFNQRGVGDDPFLERRLRRAETVPSAA